MIAFDFDGVLIPDCEHIPFLKGRDDYYRFTKYMKPMFQPNMDYCIITGRPKSYRELTSEWCQLHLKKQPVILFHENTETATADYKIKVLNANRNIEMFVESSLKNVEKMRPLVECKVFHFSSYFNQVLKEDLLMDMSKFRSYENV